MAGSYYNILQYIHALTQGVLQYIHGYMFAFNKVKLKLITRGRDQIRYQ